MTGAQRSMATHRSEVNRCSIQDLIVSKDEKPNSEPKYAVHTALSEEGGNYPVHSSFPSFLSPSVRFIIVVTKPAARAASAFWISS